MNLERQGGSAVWPPARPPPETVTLPTWRALPLEFVRAPGIVRAAVGLSAIAVCTLALLLIAGLAGVQREGLEPGCVFDERFEPPSDASASAFLRADWSWFPLGIRCTWASSAGGVVETSDLSVVLSVAFVLTTALAAVGAALVLTAPFGRFLKGDDRERGAGRRR